jgi:hypothetical protein
MCRSPVILPPVVIRGTAVVVVLVAAALAGCNAEADPTPLPPLPSVSPTPETLQVPPEATPATAQGAAAFARYFFGTLVNQAYVELDAAAVRAWAGDQCKSCENIAADVERLRAANLRVLGERFKIAYAEAAPPEPDGSIVVDMRFSSDPYIETAADGSQVREEPAQVDVDAQVKLEQRSGRWLVTAIRTL